MAGDDLAVTIEEESARTEQAAAAENSAALPRAEHIDLKEVVTDPLAPNQSSPVSQPLDSEPSAAEVAPAAPTTEDGDASTKSSASGDTAESQSVNPSAPNDSEVAPLVLLGAEVPASTATRLSWSPKESFAGIAVPTPVLVVHGARPGPRLCLTAAVHGDELNGIEIVRRVMYDLEPEKLSGTVIGVPIVNLQGFRRASRYLPDRRDLNRYFPGNDEGSSASRIAHSFFNEIIRHCDLLVDLHTGSFQRTNLPQLRADLNYDSVATLANDMGSIVVLQSRGAHGSLRRAAVEAGVPAVTVEAGEPHNVQPDSVNHGVASIETLLHNRDMYPQRGLWARKTEPVYYKSRWVRAPNGGVLISQIKLGERVQRGETLGTVTDPITNYRSDIVSPITGRVIGMALNQVMLPGFAAYHIGYQATAEEAAQQDAGPEDTAGDEAAAPSTEEMLEQSQAEPSAADETSSMDAE